MSAMNNWKVWNCGRMEKFRCRQSGVDWCGSQPNCYMTRLSEMENSQLFLYVLCVCRLSCWSLWKFEDEECWGWCWCFFFLLGRLLIFVWKVFWWVNMMVWILWMLFWLKKIVRSNRIFLDINIFYAWNCVDSIIHYVN